MKDLYELASAETLLPEIKRYLTTEIANRLAAGTGNGKLVSISGIAYLNSREVMFFAGRLLEKMAKSLRVVVWLDSKEQGNLSENRLREMFCGEIFRIRLSMRLWRTGTALIIFIPGRRCVFFPEGNIQK